MILSNTQAKQEETASIAMDLWRFESQFKIELGSWWQFQDLNNYFSSLVSVMYLAILRHRPLLCRKRKINIIRVASSVW